MEPWAVRSVLATSRTVLLLTEWPGAANTSKTINITTILPQLIQPEGSSALLVQTPNAQPRYYLDWFLEWDTVPDNVAQPRAVFQVNMGASGGPIYTFPFHGRGSLIRYLDNTTSRSLFTGRVQLRGDTVRASLITRESTPDPGGFAFHAVARVL